MPQPSGALMPRRFIKRYYPDHEKIRNHKHLRIFGSLLHDPNLWHLNRRSVSGAFFAGLFWAFQPMPFQMVAAAAAAIAFRVNLPISVALVWLTNPITMPPVFYLNYVVGAHLLGRHPGALQFQLTLDAILANLASIWAPLLLGSVVCGLVFGALGFFVVRGLWRWRLTQHLKRRRAKRTLRARDKVLSKSA